LRRMLIQHGSTGIYRALRVSVETVTLQAGPALTQRGIDKGIFPHHVGVVVLMAALYILCVIGTTLASGARVALTGGLAGDVMHDLRVRIFGHLQRLSLDVYTDE